MTDSGARYLQYDNAFWRFSLAVYGRNEVAEECLSLQETLKIDVNLLLFCAWLGTRGILLTQVEIETAGELVATWHAQVIRSLRDVRQWIKTLHRDEFEIYRTRVKDIEIEAEQIEHALLFAHAQQAQFRGAGAERRDAIAQNIKLYLGLQSYKDCAMGAQTSAPCLIDSALKTAT